MLSKEQLEDALKCNGDCNKCSIDTDCSIEFDCTKKVAMTALELLKSV
jgi:hypothetical protein